MSKLTIADFAEHECRRRTFTLIKRGPKAIQWCSWCRKMLKLSAACAVETAAREALREQS